MSKATDQQQAPKANKGQSVWQMVIADMVSREKFGIEKYGVPVQAGNGRDALVDAFQESLDLCVYLRQAIAERDALRPQAQVRLDWPEDWELVLQSGATYRTLGNGLCRKLTSRGEGMEDCDEGIDQRLPRSALIVEAAPFGGTRYHKTDGGITPAWILDQERQFLVNVVAKLGELEAAMIAAGKVGSTTSINPPLKWHGGKHYLAQRIIGLMPPRKSGNNPDGWLHYVEPYAGGLSVLLANDPEGVSEVVNDLSRDLTNFWQVLQGGALFKAFLRLCEVTPFCQAEWVDASLELQEWATPDDNVSDPVVRAWRFFVVCRMSLAGRMKTFAPLSRTRVRRGMNEQAAAWLTAVEGLPVVHERLKRVVVLNRDALDVIRGQDGPQTLFYVDAPYVHATRSTTSDYAYEMTDDQHRELIATLVGIRGKALVSMYRHPIYDALHERHGWRLHEITIANHAAGGESKRRMTECLWMNYSPA